MKRDEKINRINQIKRSITQYEDFARVLKQVSNGNIYTKECEKKENFISLISICSYIWTGSDNPKMDAQIEGKDLCNIMAKPMLKELLKKISELEIELDSLLK